MICWLQHLILGEEISCFSVISPWRKESCLLFAYPKLQSWGKRCGEHIHGNDVGGSWCFFIAMKVCCNDLFDPQAAIQSAIFFNHSQLSTHSQRLSCSQQPASTVRGSQTTPGKETSHGWWASKGLESDIRR